MTEAKHTPGPWTQAGASIRVDVHGDDYRLLARVQAVQNNDWCEAFMNARLIAAAPDLLAACEQLVSEIPRHTIRQNHVWAGVIAAIAKAKGE